MRNTRFIIPDSENISLVFFRRIFIIVSTEIFQEIKKVEKIYINALDVRRVFGFGFRTER